MSTVAVLGLCALSFFMGVAAMVLWALWACRPAKLSEAERRRAAEQELQRLTFAATAQMLEEVRNSPHQTRH